MTLLFFILASDAFIILALSLAYWGDDIIDFWVDLTRSLLGLNKKEDNS